LRTADNYVTVFGVASAWARLFGRAATADTPADAARRMSLELAAELDHLDPFDLPTVVAGRQLIADTVAMLPMVGVAGRGRIDPTPALLRRPDPSEPYRQTLERIVNSMTGPHGCAWLDVITSGYDGWPLAVEVIDPSRVTYELTPNRARLARVWVDGRDRELSKIRLIPFRSDPGPIGTSPLADIRIALDQLAAAFRFAATYYDAAAAVPPYAVVHPNRLTAAQASDHLDAWMTARAERRPAMLSGGITLQTFNPTSAADALVLDAINYLDAAVARVLQIPPSLLNVVSQSALTYSTTLDERQRWLQLGLYPGYLARIEAAFSDLMVSGTSAVFDTSNLVRMDFAGRITAYAASIAAGIHTPAEVRALEGLPVVPAADPAPITPNVEGL
jgi:HK97 family phage portal protein